MSQFSLNGAAFAIIILIFGCYGAHWGEQYTSCIGKYPSPIHLNEMANITRKAFKDIIMKGFNVSATSAELRNNGQTILINLNFSETPTIEGGALEGKGVYKFSHLQFHWFDTESLDPQARTLNISYPYELQIVFFNELYASVNQARMVKNGITVLVFSIKIRAEEHEEFKELIELVEKVTEPNSSASFVNPVQLKDFMKKYLFKYFVYSGTMLTPPCTADVIWIDFEENIFLSVEQYSALDIFGDYWSMKKNPDLGGIVHERHFERMIEQEKGSAIPLSYARNKAKKQSRIGVMWWMLLMTIGFFF